MANYKDIHGTTVRNSAGNLTGAATGELFYDSTNSDFKYRFPTVTTAGTWRTGNNLNSARQSGGGFGIYTAALMFGGTDGTNRSYTEAYDGTSWTEVNDLATSRSYNVGSGSGDGSSANNSQQMYAAGVTGPSSTANTTATEEWNIPDFEIKSVTTS